MNRSKRASLLGFLLVCSSLWPACHEKSDSGNQNGDGAVSEDGGVPSDALVLLDGATITVEPVEIGDILENPGMGFADFHGWVPSPPEHPSTTVAYYRWTWAELEPTEGEFDFAMVEDTIDAAVAKGETLAFRIMPVWQDSSPEWLLDMGVASVAADDGVFPDHNDPLFLQYHQRLVQAFGERFNGSLDIDHLDIGSVGCWGEWNTACCSSTVDTCDQYFPTEANQVTIVDWYFDAFPDTPLVMLIGGQVEYATSRGAGWRGDCFGDYGIFSSTWNHMDHSYGPAAADPIVGNAWKTAPVQFEVCGVMQDWHDLDFDIDLILQKGLEWHLSVLNAKSSPVPSEWRTRVEEFQRHMGYRLVLRRLTHGAKAARGGSLLIQPQWENIGVAPFYHPWPLAYRLRSASDEVAAQWSSSANLRTWLPGAWQVEDLVSVSSDVAPGSYSLELAILTEDGARAHVKLAIEGARTDTWYALSQIDITD